MTDSLQPQIIKSGQTKVGRKSGFVCYKGLLSGEENWVGRRSKSLLISRHEAKLSPGGSKVMVLAGCTTCGKEGFWAAGYFVEGRAGCRPCGNPPSIPRWLLNRCIGAKQRCTNPKTKRWKDYGGRGIKFLFESPVAMGIYIQKNLGLDRSRQIDRIDNDKHYGPGNLRLSTGEQNQSHTRKNRLNPSFHEFRARYPEVRYADSTLRRLICIGLSFSQIVERWKLPSFKPKGVYGTYSTPDPYIASLHRDL
jgi:hypothetical protein